LRIQTSPPEYSKQAIKYLKRLDVKTKKRIKEGIEKIPLGDIKPYLNNPDYLRLRIGGYRILFKWIANTQILIAIIDNRGHSYKKGV
jgi:mRNA interferase RelE/StbE